MDLFYSLMLFLVASGNLSQEQEFVKPVYLNLVQGKWPAYFINTNKTYG